MTVSSALRVSLLTLCCASSHLLAADLAGVAPPIDAKVVSQHEPTEQERTYPLAAVRKISNQLRMDSQISARGQVGSVTYELPAELTAGDAFDQARKALQAQGGQILFWCVSRDCGESSLWANEILGNATLYGADEQQAFLVLRRAAPAQDTLEVLYSITRGNKRAYLHVEEFVAATPLGELLPTAPTVLRELKSTGALDYPELVNAPPAPWVTLLARSLNLDSTLRVSLSGSNAKAWRQALIDGGVRAARLETGDEGKVGLHVELIR
jgi:hypothetical protein